MANMTLAAQPRTVLGKKVSALRRSGITPGNIYGHNVPSTAIQLNTHDLELLLRGAGRTHLVTLSVQGEPAPRNVLVRDMERKPTTGAILHVDFMQVSMTEKLRLYVPLVLTGHAPVTDVTDAIVFQNLEQVEVECLPGEIPNHIEVDISTVRTTTDTIRVGDLLLPLTITVLSDPEAPIVSVTLQGPAEEAEEAEVAAADHAAVVAAEDAAAEQAEQT